MSKHKKQQYDGVVYSTESTFDYQFAELAEEQETLANHQQQLKVQLDRKMRKGKVVTLVTGFRGTQENLESLGKLLKQKCGVGGTAKDAEIMIQGDFKVKIAELLLSEGFKVKLVGG